MATPMNPGWYPAPDGNGEQWWNGSGWSDSRRNPDGTTPGLPNYQAAPPPGSAPSMPPPPVVPSSTLARAAQSTSGSIVPIVFGIVGLVAFNLFSVFAIFAGIATFKSTSTLGRVLAGIGILLGVIGVVVTIVSFLRSGGHDIFDLIF